MRRRDYNMIKKTWAETEGQKGILILMSGKRSLSSMISIKAWIEHDSDKYKFIVEEFIDDDPEVFIDESHPEITVFDEFTADQAEKALSDLNVMVVHALSRIGFDHIKITGSLFSKDDTYCYIKLFKVTEHNQPYPDYNENADYSLHKGNIPKLDKIWRESSSSMKGAVIFQYDQKTGIPYFTIAHFGFGNESPEVGELDLDTYDDYIYISVFTLYTGQTNFAKLKTDIMMVDSTETNCHTSISRFCDDVIDTTGFTHMADYQVLNLFNV